MGCDRRCGGGPPHSDRSLRVGARVADDRHELGVELAKGGITLFAIAILGGALAAAFRSLDERRQEARRIDEYRAATADELWDAYHSIKAVRRLLVVAGFAEAKGRLSGRSAKRFTLAWKRSTTPS